MEQATAGHVGKLWIIVLAAGRSQRLGRAKQLLRLRGRTLLARTLAQATSLAGNRVIAVIGAERARIRAHISRNAPQVRCVFARKWRAGMGASLAAGVDALPDSASAALVLLCDQPKIDRRTLRRLLQLSNAQRHSRIVAGRYRGRLGVPAVFPRRAFAMLRRLDADQGARALLNNADSGFRVVAVNLPEAACDVDTPQDVAALSRK